MGRQLMFIIMMLFDYILVATAENNMKKYSIDMLIIGIFIGIGMAYCMYSIYKCISCSCIYKHCPSCLNDNEELVIDLY